MCLNIYSIAYILYHENADVVNSYYLVTSHDNANIVPSLHPKLSHRHITQHKREISKILSKITHLTQNYLSIRYMKPSYTSKLSPL